MSETSNHIPLTRVALKIRFPVRSKWFSGLVLAALLLTWWPAQAAEDPDDAYLRIFDMIQQADTMNANGQTAPALAKYQQAQVALANFQRSFPDRNGRAVAYRINYLAEKIAALTAKLAPPESGAGTNAPETQAGTTPGGMGTSGAQVKLIEAGTEPRKALRLHPQPGDKQTVTMTTKMGVDMKVGDMPNQAMKLPAMKMSMDVSVKSVSTEGDISYEMVMSEATVADEPGIMPQIADAMKSSLSTIKGLSMTGTVSSRGFDKALQVKMPPGADAQVRQAMEQMKESFSRIAVPLPEEAVGAGAKWEVRMPLKSQGMTINQTATYELASLEGERVATKAGIAQSASNQKIPNPAMPAMKVDLDKMVVRGTGDITFDLGKVVAPEGTMDSHSELLMSVNTGGQKQTITMTVDLNLRLEAK